MRRIDPLKIIKYDVRASSSYAGRRTKKDCLSVSVNIYDLILL
jgi:hypothetical protein